MELYCMVDDLVTDAAVLPVLNGVLQTYEL